MVLRAVAVCMHARVRGNDYVLAPDGLTAKRPHSDVTPGHMGLLQVAQIEARVVALPLAAAANDNS